MSRRLFSYGVIYGLRTDELDGTSTVSINTAESTQHHECSTIIGDLQERHQSIFHAKPRPQPDCWPALPEACSVL
jgi:hypothetical protein